MVIGLIKSLLPTTNTAGQTRIATIAHQTLKVNIPTKGLHITIVSITVEPT